MIDQVVKGYSAGLAALKEELKKPELDATNVTELVAEIGEAVADVGDVSRILAAEDNSELGKTFLGSWAAINFVGALGCDIQYWVLRPCGGKTLAT